jgi:hypothetical protein
VQTNVPTQTTVNSNVQPAVAKQSYAFMHMVSIEAPQCPFPRRRVQFLLSNTSNQKQKTTDGCCCSRVPAMFQRTPALNVATPPPTAALYTTAL